MEQFSEMVKSHMEQRFGDGYQIKVCKVRKNNGVCRTGLNIVKKIKLPSPQSTWTSIWRNTGKAGI